MIQKNQLFAESETPCYIGRAVAALAADPNVLRKAGKVWGAWTLAKEYGFRDIDGRQPDWGPFFDRTVAAIVARDPVDDQERAAVLAATAITTSNRRETHRQHGWLLLSGSREHSLPGSAGRVLHGPVELSAANLSDDEKSFF